jgi:aldose 1-epimerase
MIQVSKKLFGVLSDGSEINLYTLSNGDITVSASDYGCLLTSIMVPKKNGGYEDLLLGFSSLDSFIHRNGPHFGALVGRYANRIQNARFTLNGKTYQLDKNNGEASLHGGFKGYNQRVWKSEPVETREGKGVRFTGVSLDKDQGYPGNLELEILYVLNQNNELILRYTGKPDADTPVNLTNHAYFNLKGEAGGTVAGHIAQINSNKYLEVNKSLIPTGRVLPTAGTVFDFSTPMALGRHFGAPELALMNDGYDVAYCFDLPSTKEGLRLLATITEPETGRVLTCSSNQPSMQLYTGCMLSLKQGKNGFDYQKFGAFCLETQQYVNAPNVPQFPSPVIKAGQTYESVTRYGFAVQ